MKKIKLLSFILSLLMMAACFSVYASASVSSLEIKNGAGSLTDIVISNTGMFEDSEETGEIGVRYEICEQIELYLNGETRYIYDFIDWGPDSIQVYDEEILEIRNAQFVPKMQGVTYISCAYGNTVKNYNVIVHDGAENVISWTIGQTSSGVFQGFLGKKYQIRTLNSSNCNISDLKITASTKYSEVGAEELVRLGKNGEIEIIGIGECEIWIRSATNMLDKGVKIKVSSSFEDQMLGEAVSRWFDENIALTEEGVITENEIKCVTDLTFNQLVSFQETEWKALLPSLKTIRFDLSRGDHGTGAYKISSGDLKYHFIGSQGKANGFSIVTDNRENLNITFENLFLSPSDSGCLNFANVQNVYAEFLGVCQFNASQGYSGDGYNAINAQQLTIALNPKAVVGFKGGDGTSVSGNGTRNGGYGILVNGKLSICSLAPNIDASLSAQGGKGGNAYDNGTDGGNGGIGIKATELSAEGTFTCNITGGAGGKGSTGKAGVYRGNDGQQGGMGGHGATALVCQKLYIKVDCIFRVTGGTGGDGGTGGAGAKGTWGATGNSAKENGAHIFNSGVDASPGGDGGTGGAGGRGGNGGNGGYAIQVTDYFYNESRNIVAIGGNGGTGGQGGRGGDGGEGGEGGRDDYWGGSNAPGRGGNGGKGGRGGNGGTGGNRGVASNSAIQIDGLNIVGSDGNLGFGGLAGGAGDGGERGTGGSAGDSGANGSSGDFGKSGSPGEPGKLYGT